MPENVREAMIKAAWLLIAERGLEGMSTREVLARTGAPRGSVYHHFPRGRAELIELAIDHSRRWMQDQIDAIRAETPDGVVTGYIDIWRRVVEGTHFQAGCATTGAVTGGHEPGILGRAEAAFTATSDALAARFRQVGLTPDDAERRATLLMYAAEGAVILARARRSVEPLTFIAEQLSGSPSQASPDSPPRSSDTRIMLGALKPRRPEVRRCRARISQFGNGQAAESDGPARELDRRPGRCRSW